MPIKPVSGEVKSQDINDNISYLDNKLNQVNAGPLGTLNNTAELNSKYPNGANGYFVVLESDGKTGYMYTWNGSNWIRGALYQAMGLADKSVTEQKLAFHAANVNPDNIFDPAKITQGRYVDSTTGSFPSRSGFNISEYIEILPSSRYKIEGTAEQLGFYSEKDSSAFISGLSNATKLEGTVTPVKSKYIRITVKDEELSKVTLKQRWALDNTNITKTNIEYITENLELKDESINETKLAFQPAIVNPINLFDKSKVTVGRYVNYQNGSLPSKAGYNTSDYIPVLPNTRYKIDGTKEQLAFYSDKAASSYVSGLSSASLLEQTLIPSSANYIRITVKDAELDSINLKQRFGLDNANFVPENITYLSEQLGLGSNKVITVKKDGKGDYTRLRDAIAAAERGTTIKIYPGTYSLTDEFTADEINATTFQGFFKDRDVSWEGVGVRGSIILLGDLEGYSTTTITRVSTIHLRAGGDLSNIMAIGKNVRYAMHDDDGWPNVKKRFSTCDFKKKGTSGGYAQAVGGGTYSGSEHIYDDCTFETDWDDVPVSYHNNVNFTLPSKVEFIDCNYITPSVYQLRFGSMGSGMKDIINLIGNRFSKVLVKEEKMNGVGIDFFIKGRGNRQFSIDVQSTVSSEIETDFVEEVAINII